MFIADGDFNGYVQMMQRRNGVLYSLRIPLMLLSSMIQRLDIASVYGAVRSVKV